MWASMSNDLHKQHEKYTYAKDILLHLQDLFGEQSRTARYVILKQLFMLR